MKLRPCLGGSASAVSPAAVSALVLFFLLALSTASLYAASVGGADSAHGGDALTHRMTQLVLQIAVVLFAGHFGAVAARKLHIPVILGELVAGIVVGPYGLGRIPLPGYAHGLIPPAANALAVSPELFGFAVVASVVLLFLTGLQTDLRLFLRFAFGGAIIGLGGALLSLAAGVSIGSLLLAGPTWDVRNIFLGVVAIATSVDISARILSERRKMASPEGVTILAASVIEDVVGITLLAIVVGVESLSPEGPSRAQAVLGVAARAIGVWAGFTALGVLFARRLSNLLKRVRSHAQIAVLALGIALLVAGLFEGAGLAMIIGAYVAGLSLSNTDIAYVVQEKIETVHQFFDPIFFTVMGMLVNVSVLFSVDVFVYGLAFGVLAVASKLVGCAVPSLFLGFTRSGAARIGFGMAPRGEVALIIASIGIGSGIVDDRLFGVIIFMTLFTTLATPPVFSRLLASGARSTRREIESDEQTTTPFEFGSADITQFVLADVLAAMRNEGFFINAIEGEYRVYHMRRDSIFIALMVTPLDMHFTSRKDDVTLIRSVVYESILTLQQRVGHLKRMAKPVELQRSLVANENRALVDWYRYIDIETITLRMQARDKESAIRELVELLVQAGKVNDREAALSAVLEREASMTTGMQHGLAIPHGRTNAARELCVAVGLAPQGIDFASIDGQPARIIYLIVSPVDNPGPHLQVLAGIAGILNTAEAREEILRVPSRTDLIAFMARRSKSR